MVSKAVTALVHRLHKQEEQFARAAWEHSTKRRVNLLYGLRAASCWQVEHLWPQTAGSWVARRIVELLLQQNARWMVCSPGSNTRWASIKLFPVSFGKGSHGIVP